MENTLGIVLKNQALYALKMFAPGSMIHGVYGYMLHHNLLQADGKSGLAPREHQALLADIQELQMEEVTTRVERAIAAAVEVRSFAQARYSHFRVGAALLGGEGQIIKGVNVESSSYGLTICAERSALVSALAQGIEDIAAVVVCTDTPQPVSPCGACRQLLMDYAPDAIVIMHTVGGSTECMPLRDLLPKAFGHEQLR